MHSGNLFSERVASGSGPDMIPRTALLRVTGAAEFSRLKQTMKSTILCAAILTVFACRQISVTAQSSGSATQTQKQPDQDASKEVAKLNKRGLDHFEKKQYDEAIRLFRKALDLQPDSADVLNNLGKALDAVGKDDEAIADFDKALKLAPENAIIHCNKGLALFHEKKFEESIASYRKAIEIHENFAEAQNGLGAALFSLGRTDEAISAFRKGLQLDPKNIDALNNLGAALMAQHKAEEAIPFLHKARKL